MVIYDIENYQNITDKDVKKCLEFLAQNGNANIALGRHEVDENGIYVMISEYNTRLKEQGMWEAHKKYIDLQLVLSGEEYLHVSSLHHMKTGVYEEEKDFLPCQGEVERTLHMVEGKAVLLMPDDVHMPNMSIDETISKVKKAVFKIPVFLMR